MSAELHGPRRAEARRFRRQLSDSGSVRRKPLPSAVTHGSLRDGLLICLGLLDRDPGRFESAAVAWFARWCADQRGVGFTEAQTVLAGLRQVAEGQPIAGARQLSSACAQRELDDLVTAIETWLEQQRSEPAAASGRQ